MCRPSTRTRCARSTASSATSACAPTATSSTSRSSGSSPITSTTRTSSRSSAARCTTRSTSSSSAAASVGCSPAPACVRPASRICGSSRRAATSAARGTGTAIPERAVRRRVVRLPAAARRARLRSEGEVHPGAGDPRTQPGDRPPFRPVPRRAVPDRGHRVPLGRSGPPLDHLDESWRRAPGAVRLHGERPAAPSEAPRHPRHRDATPAIRSTPAAGITPTPVATPTADSPDWPTNASASSARARPPCSACPHLGAHAEHLYVFQRTPSSIDVRNNRPTDPEWAASLQPGWQTAPDGELQHPRLGRASSRRTWSTTAGPTSSAGCC